METPLSKQARATLFRTRLETALREAGANRSALARAVGADRSTISQVLGDDGPRLPNAHIIGAAAAFLGVSADWLLGLSDQPENVDTLVARAMTVTRAPRALIDEQIFGWHQEAAGYKIRHVPAALPDMLKTRDTLEWEYGPHLGRTTAQAIAASEDRLQWMRGALSDYEIALPLYEMQSFSAGTGYYRGLPLDVRMAQMDHILRLCEQLYPRLRLYLFDARRLYSAPITIFGPLRAALYVGGHYMTFRDRDRIETLTAHFDDLVREAAFTARDVPDHLHSLRSQMA